MTIPTRMRAALLKGVLSAVAEPIDELVACSYVAEFEATVSELIGAELCPRGDHSVLDHSACREWPPPCGQCRNPCPDCKAVV